MARSDKTHLMVHCLATHPNQFIGKSAQYIMDWCRKLHVNQNGWRDVGYAAIITRKGEVVWGRDLDNDGDFLEETAAAAKGWNKNAIHVSLEGGHGSSATDNFEDHFTPEQNAALRILIDDIRAEFPQTLLLIGHNETAAKGCPGFNVRSWFDNKPQRSSIMQSTTAQASIAGGLTTVVGGVNAVAALDGTAQIIMIVSIVLMVGIFAYIFRERLKKFARGIV